MATLLTVTVQSPQDEIDRYGTGALVRIERGTSVAMTDAAEIATVAIVAGKNGYEYRDSAGIAGTHWYRVRYSAVSPDGDDDYSGYSDPQLASDLLEWCSLEDVKYWLDIPETDTDDDTPIRQALAATNAYITQCVGRFIGPSTDTTRTYRRIEPDEDGRVLWIPGGIRSFTTLELRRASTDAWETVTAGDVELGPPSWDLRPGQAYQWLEFIDDPTGSWLSFPYHGELRISGARFGPEMPDPSAAQIARTVVTRMWEAREEGSLRNPTPSRFVYSDDRDVLRALGMEHVAGLS